MRTILSIIWFILLGNFFGHFIATNSYLWTFLLSLNVAGIVYAGVNDQTLWIVPRFIMDSLEMNVSWMEILMGIYGTMHVTYLATMFNIKNYLTYKILFSNLECLLLFPALAPITLWEAEENIIWEICICLGVLLARSIMPYDNVIGEFNFIWLVAARSYNARVYSLAYMIGQINSGTVDSVDPIAMAMIAIKLVA